MEESLIAALRKLFWKNCRRTSGNCGEHQLGTSHDNNDNNNNNNNNKQAKISLDQYKTARKKHNISQYSIYPLLNQHNYGEIHHFLEGKLT